MSSRHLPPLRGGGPVAFGADPRRCRVTGMAAVLTVIKIADAEYTIGQVALGIEEYYLGDGEAPGVWAGRWAPTLGLEGVVAAGELRALVNGVDPTDGTWWLEGRPARSVNAFDATFSAPKSASLLWAFGSPDVASVVARAHVEAVAEALAFLEGRAAVSRQQTGGVRTRVTTDGWAVATFVHRTSRAGDPQLHTHCVIPNVVRRADGSYASVDGAALYEWAKPAGSVYQEQLRRILTEQLGVAWGADRNGCREMVGFNPAQLRTFSKRTSQIEAYLERAGGVYVTAVERMRADHLASLATRADKDRTLTPERLRDQWAAEAAAVGLGGPGDVERAVTTRHATTRDATTRHGAVAQLTWEQVVDALCHPDTGLCENDSRFGQAHVIERVAALGAGRLTVAEIETLARDFLASEHVVRLSAEPAEAVRTPPRWTTAAHLALEQRVLSRIETLIDRPVIGMPAGTVERAIAADRLAADQADAVRALCADGPALRSLIAPAGFGKTTAVHAAAMAAADSGRPVLGVATTNRAVAVLVDVGIPAVTIARLAMELTGAPLPAGCVVILDETSQTSTADAEVVLAAVDDCPGAQLWCLGDVRQAQAVRAGGLAAELETLGQAGRIPAPALVENRRQQHAAERAALQAWRTGDLVGSQEIRSGAGLEHEHATPTDTRDAMADALAADVLAFAGPAVVGLTVAHADCEDIADRVRGRLAAAGLIGGPSLEGPGWGSEARRYQAGDRVLLHARVGRGSTGLVNGTTVTVSAVSGTGLSVVTDSGAEQTLPAEFVAGSRGDGRPNLSHAWCRTVDGAQGGTWDRAHLLGTAALDNFSAYVGQSRARVETHTWNVARVPAGDWGGRLADQRTGAEQVLAAASRAPLKTFAAHDDPETTDRRLRAEITEHEAVLAAGPPDVTSRLAEARHQVVELEARIAGLREWAEHATRQAARFGPFAALRSDNRALRDTRAQLAEGHRHNLTNAQTQLSELTATIGDLERAEAQREAWENREGWRTGRIPELHAELDRQWTQAVLGAVSQDDPLAYGIDRLRHARTTITDELARLDTSLPPDRADQLTQAELALGQIRNNHTSAAKAKAEAVGQLADVSRRRLGRRDQPAISTAEQRLASVTRTVERLDEAVAEAEGTVQTERAAVAARAGAQAATDHERRTLTHNLYAISEALDATRPQRVGAGVDGHPDGQHLRDLLGTPPDQPAGRAVWRELAARIEAALDDPTELTRMSWSSDRHDTLVHQLLSGTPYAKHLAALTIDVAANPGQHADHTPRHEDVDLEHEPLTPRPPSHDRGLGLGLGL